MNFQNRHARRAVRALKVLTMAAAPALFLAACGSSEPEPPPEPACPNIKQLPDIQEKVAFTGGGRDLTDVEYQVRLVDGIITCEKDDDEIDAEFEIQFIVERGPADDDRQAVFSYFAAILNPQGQVAAREEFSITVPFEGNQNRVSAIDLIEPTIPLKEGESARGYTVYVGLVLTREELEYNRRNQ